MDARTQLIDSVVRLYKCEWAAAAAAYDAGVAAERGRCAKLCDEISDEYQRSEGRKYPELKTDAQEGAAKCADVIRRA